MHGIMLTYATTVLLLVMTAGWVLLNGVLIKKMVDEARARNWWRASLLLGAELWVLDITVLLLKWMG